MAREIDKIARGRKNVLGALRDLGADIGERDLARPALDQRRRRAALQIANLHRQRRLGDRAGLGGPAEMPVLGRAPPNNATVAR